MVTFKKHEDGSVQPYLEESDHGGAHPTHGEGWSGEHTYGCSSDKADAAIEQIRAEIMRLRAEARAEATAAWKRCEEYRVALEELIGCYAKKTITGVIVASDEQYPHIAKAMRVLEGEK